MAVNKKLVVFLSLISIGLLLAIGCNSTPTVTIPTEPNVVGTNLEGGTVFNISNSAEIVGTSASRTLTAQLDGQNDSSASVNYVAVVGSSSLEVVPNKAQLNISVEAKANTVAEATTQAGLAQAQILTSARGISGAGEFNSTVSIRQNFVWDSELSRSVFDGFIVTYSINFSIVSATGIGELAGQAVAAAVNAGGDLVRINSVSFEIDDPTTFESMARSNAAKNARLRATDYTQALNVTLGNVLTITENGTNNPQPFLGAVPELSFATGADTTTTQSFTVEAGLVTVSASVQVAFAINN